MRLLPAIILLSWFSVGATNAEDGVGWQVGDRFPDLVLPSLDGREPLSVKSFRGRKVILHVFASW